MLSFKIIGLAALTKKLGSDTVKKPLGEGIKKIVFTLEGEVKKATVIDTNRLRSSIFSKYGASEGMVGTNVQYAPFVEYGTRHMEARHMEGGRKELGQGMFGFGLEQLQKKMSGLLKAIGVQIENRWGR
ncbi:MAG: HK97 gp10 family phage protein [Candidatus Marinimicrobia bacterium]|nr:HK97 gp10 family phage protein [Candidatus Neomarinimicrobiota bacterium]